jgi:hypothetical protein
MAILSRFLQHESGNTHGVFGLEDRNEHICRHDTYLESLRVHAMGVAEEGEALRMHKGLISQHGKPDKQHQDISHCAYPLRDT